MNTKFILTFLFIVLLTSCKKSEYLVTNPKKNWLAYQGEDAYLKSISLSILNSEIKGTSLPKDEQLTAVWQKSGTYLQLGDSTSKFLLPVVSKDSILSGYLRVELGKNDSFPDNVRFISYQKDYKQNIELRSKAKVATELKIISKKIVLMPADFSEAQVKRLLKKSRHYQRRAAKMASASHPGTLRNAYDTQCEERVSVAFEWWPGGACLATQQMMITEFKDAMDLQVHVWAINNSAQVLTMLGQDAYYVYHDGVLAGQLEPLIQAAATQFIQAHSACRVTVTSIDITTDCGDDDGGDNGGGGGGGTGEEEDNDEFIQTVDFDEEVNMAEDEQANLGGGYVPIKYKYWAQITRNKDTRGVIFVEVYPTTADPILSTYIDNYGRPVTRTLTLLAHVNPYEIYPDGVTVAIQWKCDVHGLYSYWDNTPTWTRQWTNLKFGLYM